MTRSGLRFVLLFLGLALGVGVFVAGQVMQPGRLAQDVPLIGTLEFVPERAGTTLGALVVFFTLWRFFRAQPKP